MKTDPTRTVKAAFAEMFRDRPSEEILAAAKSVDELTDQPGWEFLTGLLDDKRRRITDACVHGPVLDQATYVAQMSLISGMEQVIYLPAAIAQIASETERDLKQLAGAHDGNA